MKITRLILSLTFLSVLFFGAVFAPSQAEARWHRGFRWYGGHYWNHGYWFHGAYGARAGWWWVVGPTWYYYPAPVYPYPAIDVEPAYIVQGGSAPPPASGLPPAPSAPAPSAKEATAVPTSGGGPIQAFPSSGNSASAQGKGKAFSYFCDKSKAYYPTVSSCPDGWVATPVQSPN